MACAQVVSLSDFGRRIAMITGIIITISNSENQMRRPPGRKKCQSGSRLGIALPSSIGGGTAPSAARPPPGSVGCFSTTLDGAATHRSTRPRALVGGFARDDVTYGICPMGRARGGGGSGGGVGRVLARAARPLGPRRRQEAVPPGEDLRRRPDPTSGPPAALHGA